MMPPTSIHIISNNEQATNDFLQEFYEYETKRELRLRELQEYKRKCALNQASYDEKNFIFQAKDYIFSIVGKAYYLADCKSVLFFGDGKLQAIPGHNEMDAWTNAAIAVNELKNPMPYEICVIPLPKPKQIKTPELKLQPSDPSQPPEIQYE